MRHILIWAVSFALNIVLCLDEVNRQARMCLVGLGGLCFGIAVAGGECAAATSEALGHTELHEMEHLRLT
jgi:hypothetical protein